jgi:glycine hydroxymethyltransferase
LELVNIAANKNTVPGDKSALIPHGLRMGSPAMTTRGLVEKDFDQIVSFVDRAIKLTINLKGQVSGMHAFSYAQYERYDTFAYKQFDHW